jgi:hypothetical protein
MSLAVHADNPGHSAAPHTPLNPSNPTPSLPSPCLASQALRQDPDFSAASRALKRLRSLKGGKERGNTAFFAGNFKEAYEQYTKAIEADPELKNLIMAQVGG